MSTLSSNIGLNLDLNPPQTHTHSLRLQLLLLFSAAVVLVVAPFVFLRAMQGDFEAAAVNTAILLAITALAAHAWRHPQTTRATAVLTLFYTGAVTLLVYQREALIFLWLYPVVVANVFILPGYRALLLNSLPLLALPSIHGRVGTLDFCIFLGSLLLVQLLAFIVARVTDRRRQAVEHAESALRGESRRLAERVKELRCLNRITGILEDRDLGLYEALARIVRELPPAWQHADIACAQIVVDGHVFATEDYRDSEWRQSQPIRIDGQDAGSVTVSYGEARPASGEGPFQREERDLLNLVAERIGDFVERDHNRRALAAHAEQMQRSKADMAQIAFAASHDLQEPLRAVSGYAQLLVKRYGGHGDETGAAYADHMVEAAQRMHELIDGLSQYSHLTIEDETTAPANLTAILGDALSELQHEIERTGARVSHDELPTLPVKAGRLRQVFRSLLGNALKFRGEAPPQIHIDAEPGDRLWTISVRDNGIGIPPEHAQRVFDLHKRLHARDLYAGNGLGLTVCRRIVEDHGGRIWVEPGDPGCLFRFTLPAAPA